MTQGPNDEMVPYEMQRTFDEDVEGAPFRIGQWVQFIEPLDATIDAEGLNRVGRVASFNYGMGCGESYPQDPGIIIYDLPHDFYWKNELRALTEQEVAQIIEESVQFPIEVMRPQIERSTERYFVLSSAINDEV